MTDRNSAEAQEKLETDSVADGPNHDKSMSPEELREFIEWLKAGPTTTLAEMEEDMRRRGVDPEELYRKIYPTA